MGRSWGLFALLAVLALPALSLQKRLDFSLNPAIFGLFGAKKQPPPGWILHKQSVDLDKVDLKSAKKPCANWAWVAGIVTMAEAQGTRIDQEYFVDRLYGGSVCLTSAGDMSDLAQQISHDYVLPDGQKFRLAATFAPGAPTQADALILAMRQGAPLMLLWRNHAYLLIGIDYDEYVAPTGNKMFIITELRLFDLEAQGAQPAVKFVRERDNANELGGILELSVYPK